MTYAFNIIANFLRAQTLYVVTGGRAVLSPVRSCNLSENPPRQRTLQRCFGDAGSRFVHLNNALVEHGIGDLDEPGDVCADYEIAGLPVLFRSVP